jgi:hypothetical protein
MSFEKTTHDMVHIREQYLAGIAYKEEIGLSKTVETNENFYIGKQWEGVTSNGLPTPVFNFLKRVTNYLIAAASNDRLKLIASSEGDITCDAVNYAFEDVLETNDFGSRIRRFMRNAAVDGDGCILVYWDDSEHTNEYGIRLELLENTAVVFGEPTEHRVQLQPYIIVASGERRESVLARAETFGSPDYERLEGLTEARLDVLLRLRKEQGRVLAAEVSADGLVIRPEWDTGLTHYPLVWFSWDEVRNSYHGQALVSGLIPNQIFVNKLFAMAMISLMTTAYPKIIYDKTRIDKWDNRVGSAIGVNGGDVNGAVRIVDPAAVSPQIGQFIDTAINYTQNFMGVTDAALGNVRPDNTSAIIALQRANHVPIEMIKLELYRAIEDLGRILLDHFMAYYGTRDVRFRDGHIAPFDYGKLRQSDVKLKLDVGVSNYWSEIATVQTMDNLLKTGQITLAEYLERIPDGYLIGREALLARARGVSETTQNMV